MSGSDPEQVEQIKLLMVCLGNICRSPTAEGVIKALIQARGLDHCIEVDSAGTSSWHIGEPPDPRTISAAAKRGVDLADQRGRQVQSSDFDTFDYILAMDKTNLHTLHDHCPVQYQHKLSLLLSHGDNANREVPDPYYSGTDGFELVLDLIETAGSALLDKLESNHRFLRT